MKKIKISVLCSLVLLLSLSIFSCGGNNGEENSALKVKCHNGVMVGQEKNDVVSFLGVPYAEPPVDDLRWKAPVAAPESDEEIICDEFGYTALQYEWPTEPASYEEKSEDCLTLNIWASTKETDKPKTVMVWFHGGSHAWGGTADPMYNGQNFVEAHPDIILVTANYRLGLMSWVDFSQVEGGEEYTDLNLGIRDHICALEWVRDNIEGFGGDPNNVTIFGESAGGFSTSALVISPMAEGLFNRAIMESGVVSGGDREEAQEFVDYMMEVSGAENMDDLLAISGEEWIELDTEYWIADECCGVVEDGVVIPYLEDWDAAMQKASDNGIEILVGTNTDEVNYFCADSEGDTPEEKFESWRAGLDEGWNKIYESIDAEGQAQMDEFYQITSERIADEYASDPVLKDTLIKSAFSTEKGMRKMGIDFASQYVENGGTAYMYQWNVPSTKEEYYKSACHAVELAYVFNNLEDDIYAGEVDKTTADRTQEAWINFAQTGDPSIKEAEWPAYDLTNRATMIMNLDGWAAENDPNSNIREIIQSVMSKAE